MKLKVPIEKKEHEVHCDTPMFGEHCDCGVSMYNQCLDELSQCEVFFDEEKLANVIGRKVKVTVWLENGSGVTHPYVTEKSIEQCVKAIIKAMPDILTIKKEG